ncbi:MAG TPA: hypothetical protein VJO34_12235 [Methylomirabilota bacterium]|nr:hypothetical protein [Methylomirabilota bacterium]
MKLSQENRLSQIVVLVFGAIALVYGAVFFLLPAWYLNLIGASPVPLAHIRWPGGVLIALAYGAWRFYRDPAGGQIYIATIAVAPLLGGLALLYSLVRGEYEGNGVFFALPGVLGVTISGLLLWDQRRAKTGS